MVMQLVLKIVFLELTGDCCTLGGGIDGFVSTLGSEVSFSTLGDDMVGDSVGKFSFLFKSSANFVIEL